MDDAVTLDKQKVNSSKLVNESSRPVSKKHLVSKKKKLIRSKEDKENSSTSSKSGPSVKENIGGSCKYNRKQHKTNLCRRKRTLKKLESLLPRQSSNCEVRSVCEIVKESISATCQMEDQIEKVLAKKRAVICSTDTAAKLTLNHVRSSFLSALTSTEDLTCQGQDEEREWHIENFMSNACDDFFISLANEACCQASLFSPPTWPQSKNSGFEEDGALLSENESVGFHFADNHGSNSREGSFVDQSENVPWQPLQALSTPLQNKKRLKENCSTPTPASKPKKRKTQVISTSAQASFTPWKDCSPSPAVQNKKSPVSKKRLNYPNTPLTPKKENSQLQEDITSNLPGLIDGPRKLNTKRKLYSSSSDEYSSQDTDLEDSKLGPRGKNLSQTDSIDLFVSPVEPLCKESQGEEQTLDDFIESEVSVKRNLGNPLKQQKVYFRKLAVEDGENDSQLQDLFCHSTPTETGKQFCMNGNFDSEAVSSKENGEAPLIKITPYHYYSLQYKCENSVHSKDTKSFILESKGLFNSLNEDGKTNGVSSSQEYCQGLPCTPRYVVRSKSGICSIKGHFEDDHTLREESAKTDDLPPRKKPACCFSKFHNHKPCFHEPPSTCVSSNNSANVSNISTLSSASSDSQSSVSSQRATIPLTKKLPKNYVSQHSSCNEESSFESFDSQSSGAPSSVIASFKRIILTPTQNRSMFECRAQNELNDMQEDSFLTPVGQNIICLHKGAPVKIQKPNHAAYEPACKRSLAGEFFKISLDTPSGSPLPAMEEALVTEESDGSL